MDAFRPRRRGGRADGARKANAGAVDGCGGRRREREAYACSSGLGLVCAMGLGFRDIESFNLALLVKHGAF
jgi:hypothetical protein